MSNQHRDEVIRMAREAGIEFTEHTSLTGRKRILSNGSQSIEAFEQFAKLAAEPEKKRADALAATINNILNITTTDAEGKADFVARVNAILSQCPDTRVLHAVEAEREACLNLIKPNATPMEIAAAIRARGQQ